MEKLTKVYPNGIITLNAEHFGGIFQETIDREIYAFDPFKLCVIRLHEMEEKVDKIKEQLLEVADEQLKEKLSDRYSEFSDDIYPFAFGYIHQTVKEVLRNLL